MFLFAELNHRLSTYMSREKIDIIVDSFLLAADAHETQTRSSGEPYITHPVAVACLLAEMHMDPETIMASLLHDVIEDTHYSHADLEALFGEKVAELVEGVSKLTQISFGSKAEAQAENFRKMILAMVKDIRVIIIKLTDRLHNMHTLSALKAEKRRRIAIETLEIYAPIANRLGMNSIKRSFEDLGFQALYPMRYRVLKECVKRARGNRQKLMEKIQAGLAERLKQEGVSPEHIFGREKRLFSIFKKMKNKGLPFSEIMDVYAFRIIARDLRECYVLLGAVHSVYTPIPGRFKDYIAIPKGNGYQSLHTSLFGPHGVPIEIQIRTQEMEEHAEAGIAAHWLYKSGGGYTSTTELKTREWLQNLLDMQLRSVSSLEFIENVKIDLFPDDVYVFTPGGDIKQLPKGSTPIDFAYAIHTDLGNHCIAAKIDRRLVPLSQVLNNSQTIEILTSPTATPNPTWLNFAFTPKAKSAIKFFLKSQEKEESITLGHKLLNYSLQEFKLRWENIGLKPREQLLKNLSFAQESQLFLEIGIGLRASVVVAHQLLDLLQNLEASQTHAQAHDPDNKITLSGSEGMKITYATCCYPIPGDDVRGLLEVGAGIKVHRSECPVLLNADKIKSNPHAYIHVRFSEQQTRTYPVKLTIWMRNIKGAVADIANTIADQDVNIGEFQINELDNIQGVLSAVIEVKDRKHLADVLRRERRLSCVTRIERLKPSSKILKL